MRVIDLRHWLISPSQILTLESESNRGTNVQVYPKGADKYDNRTCAR